MNISVKYNIPCQGLLLVVYLPVHARLPWHYRRQIDDTIAWSTLVPPIGRVFVAFCMLIGSSALRQWGAYLVRAVREVHANDIETS